MNLLFEDQHLLVVDKPAGLPVLPDGWEPDAPYLVKILEQHYGKIWIVHRLDKITSGVMVFARDAGMHRALNMQFESHEVEKMYHAIVEGNPKWEEQVTRFPLRVDVGHKHRTVVAWRDQDGKPSETRFRILERYQLHPERSRGAALVEAMPMTGRTHQIRVHAAAAGHPLLGDILYGAQATNLIARPALHAYALSIELNGTRNTFTAPYPDDFRAALDQLKGSS